MPKPWTQTDPELRPILAELAALEPIFHTAAFGTTLADFNRRMAPGYWETGASGRRYSRAFILDMLAQQPPLDATRAGWHTEHHALQQLGPATYLFTYTLHQGERTTRRSTLWRKTEGAWQILYHHGTIVTAQEDDSAPA